MAGRAISIEYRGDRLDIELHRIVNAPRTRAFVLIAWVASKQEWGFFRFAEIRGVELLARSFEPRRDVPTFCPRVKINRKPKQEA